MGKIVDSGRAAARIENTGPGFNPSESSELIGAKPSAEREHLDIITLAHLGKRSRYMSCPMERKPTVNCYVGEWNHRPIGLDVIPDYVVLNTTHPKNFKKALESLKTNIWSNNPYVVDCFPPENVICCALKNGVPVCKRLTEHPEFQRWGDSFDSGEFWSAFGDEWVSKD